MIFLRFFAFLVPSFFIFFPSLVFAQETSYFSSDEKILEDFIQTRLSKILFPISDEDTLKDINLASSFLKDQKISDRVYLVVDRNPVVQRLFVVVPHDQEWHILGTFKVSTGKPGRKDHYETPVGVYSLDGSILGYRAQGTKNENGIRGIGRKGMRVWDFGWVDTKDWRTHSRTTTQIRMEMHATDPDILEQRLGRPDSEGCIRIPSALNQFIDQYGLLDKDVEFLAQTSRSRKALLSPLLVQTPLAGNTVVIVDSSL